MQGSFSGYLSTLGDSPLYLRNASGSLVASNSYAVLAAQQFAPGNLAVLRVGDGAEDLSSHGNSVFVDQYATNGAFVSTVPIPDYGTNALLISGSASSEGALTRSADGRLLVLAGYNVALTNSASSLSGTASTAVPRVLGVVDVTGTFTLVAITTNQYSKNNIRSGTTDGHGNYWGAGANSGTWYFGNGTPATVQSTIANSRIIEDWGGNLYLSTSSGTPGIWSVPGTPVTAGPAPTLLLSGGSSASPFAFAFNSNSTVAYVADDTLAGTGGIQRWDSTGGNWSLSYVFTGLTNVGARGLAVDFTSRHPTLYVTTAESTNNRLVSINDTGATSIATTLATAGANQLFHGVSFAPASNFAPLFFSLSRGTKGVTLSWTALANRYYTLQFTDNLNGTNWLTLTNLTAANPVLSVTDPTTSPGTNRFYRLILNL